MDATVLIVGGMMAAVVLVLGFGMWRENRGLTFSEFLRKTFLHLLTVVFGIVGIGFGGFALLTVVDDLLRWLQYGVWNIHTLRDWFDEQGYNYQTDWVGLQQIIDFGLLIPTVIPAAAIGFVAGVIAAGAHMLAEGEDEP